MYSPADIFPYPFFQIDFVKVTDTNTDPVLSNESELRYPHLYVPTPPRFPPNLTEDNFTQGDVKTMIRNQPQQQKTGLRLHQQEKESIGSRPDMKGKISEKKVRNVKEGEREQGIRNVNLTSSAIPKHDDWLSSWVVHRETLRIQANMANCSTEPQAETRGSSIHKMHWTTFPDSIPVTLSTREATQLNDDI